MLPENFGEILTKLREVLGTENKVLNEITKYYRFAKKNEDVLAAIGALGEAFMDLLSIGVITSGNILEFADSFKQAFKDLLANTNNEKLALIAIGPQIGILLEGFRELGLKPPKWLRDLAKEAEAAGASLEPPEGLPDILADIRDLLAAIAIQLGAVSAAADDATGSFQSLGAAGNQVKVPKIPGSDDIGPPLVQAQAGFKGVVTEPTLFLAGEAGAEAVSIQPPPTKPEGMEFLAGEVGVNVNISGGNFLGTPEEISEAVWSQFNRRLRDNADGVRTEIVEAARRG
jgi:hypothetical protein